MSTAKRFIEDSFPVKEVSIESAREKNIRHGHISTLHIWWARRPLASSRATNYAALVLFAKDPRDFFPTMYIQIGRFRRTKVNLLFQEVIEGNLIQSLEETLAVLDRKFLISPVSFEGIHRIEKWQYPLPALREILLNILVHRNYMGAHTQIAVYDDNISFWNDGGLPVGWTIEDLLKRHDSMPRNPIIANACFLGGYIDAWGRGIEKIIEACKKEGLPAPEFDDSKGFRVTLYSETPALAKRKDAGDTREVTTEVKRLLKVISGEQTKKELKTLLKLRNDEHFRKAYLTPAIKLGFIEMTIPDKPRSSKQRYRLTDKGREYIK
jgi:ATP-dependent DNA helicase RecG